MQMLWKVIRGFKSAACMFRAEVCQRHDEPRENYRRRIAFFLGPPLFLLTSYGVLCLVMVVRAGDDGLTEFGKLAAGDWVYFLPGIGKIGAIPAMVEADLPPPLVAASTVFLDAVVAFFVAFNFGYVRRFPITGEFSAAFLRESESLLSRHPWLRRCSLLALVFYVMLPFKGSGGIGGTLLGLVLGLGRLKTWLAIITGSAITSFLLAYSAAAVRDHLMQVRRGGYLVLAFFAVIVAYNIFRKRKAASNLGYVASR